MESAKTLETETEVCAQQALQERDPDLVGSQPRSTSNLNKSNPSKLADSDKAAINDCISKIEDILKEVQKLQEEVAKKDNKQAVDQGLTQLNSKLKVLKPPLTLSSVDHIEEFRKQLQDQVEFFNNIKILEGPLNSSPLQLIHKNEILHGYSFNQTGTAERKNLVAKLDPMIETNEEKLNQLLLNAPPFDIIQKTNEDVKTTTQVKDLTESGGRNFGASLGGEVTNLRLNGSGKLEKGKASSETKQSEKEASTFSSINTMQIFSPTVKIEIPVDQLKLTEGAIGRLKRILDTTEEMDRNELLSEFFKIYGTHVVPCGILGGTFEIRAEIKEVTEETKKETQNVVSENLKAEISSALKFLTPNFLASFTGGLDNQKNHQKVESNMKSSGKRSSAVFYSFSLNGGMPNTTIPNWMSSLDYNTYWKTIGRSFENRIEIASLLCNHKGEDFKDYDEITRLEKMMREFLGKERLEKVRKKQEEERKEKEKLQSERREKNEKTRRSLENKFKGILLRENQECEIVGLDYDMSKITEKDFKTILGFIGNELKDLKSLNLRADDFIGISNVDFEDLVSNLGTNLKSLSLNISSQRIQDSGIKTLADKIGVKLTSLKDLHLSFGSSKISQSQIEDLVKSIAKERKKLKSLDIEFSNLKETDDDIKTIITEIGTNLTSLHTLNLTFKGSAITKTGVENCTKLFQAQLMHLENLKSLSLQFGSSNIPDDTFMDLCEQITKRLTTLRKLTLKFTILETTDKDLGSFAGLITNNLQRLESLNLQFSSNHITGSGINTFAEGIVKGDAAFKCLNSLTLSVGSNLIKDADIKKLVENIEKLDSLRDLDLYFASREITNAGVVEFGKQIGQELKTLENLSLKFGSRQITDKEKDSAFQMFINEITTNLKFLKSLSLDVSGLEITDSGLQCIAGTILKSLQKLSLTFTGTKISHFGIKGLSDLAKTNLEALQFSNFIFYMNGKGKYEENLALEMLIQKHFYSGNHNVYD